MWTINHFCLHNRFGREEGEGWGGVFNSRFISSCLMTQSKRGGREREVTIKWKRERERESTNQIISTLSHRNHCSLNTFILSLYSFTHHTEERGGAGLQITPTATHTYTLKVHIHVHACRNVVITTLCGAQPPLSSHWCADEDGRRMFLRWKKTMFWLGSVNRTAGLPFFTQIRFQLKHRRWGKLNRTTRSRRREEPLSLFLSFHALPNLVQRGFIAGHSGKSSCIHPSIHPSIYLFICLSIQLAIYPSKFFICGLFQPFFCIFLQTFCDFFSISLLSDKNRNNRILSC